MLLAAFWERLSEHFMDSLRYKCHHMHWQLWKIQNHFKNFSSDPNFAVLWSLDSFYIDL